MKIQDILKNQNQMKTNISQIMKKDYNIEIEKKLIQNIARKKFNIDFIFDSENIPVIEKMLGWFNGNSKVETEYFSLKKGILLVGSNGTGKSLLMKIFREYCVLRNIPHRYKIEDTINITQAYAEIGAACLKPYTCKIMKTADGTKRPVNLYLNDIGAEKEIENHFGSKTDIISELLYRRYEIFQNMPGIVTHGSTNFDNQMLKTRFSNRIHSRLVEMFNFVPLLGQDRRI